MMSKIVLDRFISLLKPRVLCRLRKQEKLVLSAALMLLWFLRAVPSG